MIDGYWLYTVDPSVDEPIMLLDKHIGFDEADGYGIMGDLFQKELLALDAMDKKRIQVWINSPGGSVNDGFSMYNAILKSKTPVDTKCIGIAASMAAVLFQAGRKRTMCDYGILMYHNPFGTDNTDSEALNAYKSSLVKMVSSKCGMSEDEVSKMMDKETWLGAEEAKKQGMCDDIEVSADYNRKHWKQIANVEPSDIKGYWKQSNKVLNSILNKENNNKMVKVANKLNLNEQASEDAIVRAVEGIQNKNSELETEVKNKASEVAAKNTEISGLKDQISAKDTEITTLKNQLAAIENEKKEAEKTAKAEKAKVLVENFAKEGRIKNEAPVVEMWTKKAVEDFDGTKSLIESLPLNKEAKKIENKEGEDGAPKYSFAGSMVNIAKNHKQ